MQSRFIFISHSSKDETIAYLLRDFLVLTGIPTEYIFCSSIPGNDIKEKIAEEVKGALQESKINIAILSQNYYESAYCLNEAGIIWFQEKPSIVIGMPEVTHDNMRGFLDNDNKIRRLNSLDDFSAIYDQIRNALEIKHTTTSIVINATNQAIDRYKKYLSEITVPLKKISIDSDTLNNITTDDEKIVLYYAIIKKVRKINKDNIIIWLRDMEVYNVDIDNAFDLLSETLHCKVDNGELKLEISFFRKLISDESNVSDHLLQILNNHIILSAEKFRKLLLSEKFEDVYLLFVAYIIDENVTKFGFRWKNQEQIDDIKHWEDKCFLPCLLSENYLKCINFFIDNKLVYESDWTSYQNPREYTLHKSLKEYLFCHSEEIQPRISEFISKLQQSYASELPF